MEIQLKGGHTTSDPRLDRVPQPDPRNRRYAISERLETPAWKDKVWRLPRSKYGDQGQEGACVEFGILHVCAALTTTQTKQTLTRIRSEHGIYWPAQQRDPWPGGSYPGADPRYEGTSELAGLLVARDLGLFAEFTWAFGIDEAVAGVVGHGAANLALDWTEGMSRPDPQGLIRSEGSVRGGHDVAMIGVQFGRRFDRGRFDVAVIAQSWGLDHGDRGRVYLPLADLEGLLHRGGTAAFVHGERTL